MALAGLVLIAVGFLDLVRDLVPARWGLIGASVAKALLVGVVAVLSAAVALSLGHDLLAALAPVVAAGAWWALLPDRPLAYPRLVLAVPVLLAIGVVLLIVQPAPAVSTPLRDWYGTTSLAAGLPADGALLIAGVAAFLVSSGNRIVKVALQDELGEPAAADAAPAVGGLRGGRLIGPLERILILGLFVANAPAVIAALIAAKGIVRFPEISKDAEGGNRAEYFLIGSLVSWAVALAGVGALWLAGLLP